jgi:4-hydroxythreonine-4-phosphate dehydrogenase
MSLVLPRGFLTLGLTPGCGAGVGPEVWAKTFALVDDQLAKTVRLRWFGSRALLVRGAARAGVDVDVKDERHVQIAGRAIEVMVDDADDRQAHAEPRVVTDDVLHGQRDALLRACVAAARGDLHGIVTGPVRKAALRLAGRATGIETTAEGAEYPGQTELVHHYLKSDDGPPLMVFAGAPFVLGLHTVHMALADVSAAVTQASITRSLTQLAAAAKGIVGVDAPHVVVLGVNPHAGEGGLFGSEEEDIVKPAIAALQQQGMHITGPVAADGFFADVARHKRGVATMRGVHAVLAMHHDQGLAPYKLVVGGEGVNVTWGLRVPRTSPDHGTADAIAGTGQADPSSTLAALRLCARLAERRTRPR